MKQIRRFNLLKPEYFDGILTNINIASGIMLLDGKIVLQWAKRPRSIIIFDGLEHMRIECMEGSSIILDWLD
jgi:hypothetical protein